MPISRLTSWLFLFTLFGFLSACGGSGSTPSPSDPDPTDPHPPGANTYQVSYSADAGGSIGGPRQQSVEGGADASTVAAVANEGYHFVSWSDGSSVNSRTDTGITTDLSVSASFSINTYMLNYSAGDGGSLNGEGSQEVTHGADGSVVEAVPTEGHHFVSWSDGSTANPRADTGITTDLSVSASFAINTYTLNYSAGDGGSLNGEGSQEVTHGADASVVEAVPTEGHHFVSWSDGSTANPRIDTQVTGSLGVAAQFRQTPWLIQGHQGDLQVRSMGPDSATLDWPTQSGSSYNLIVAHDPETDIDNYAAYGASLERDVSPPFELSALTMGEPVYVALETNDSVTSWTSFRPNAHGLNGSVTASVVDPDGRLFVGGEFTHFGSRTGSGIAIPALGDNVDHPLAWPIVGGSVFAAISDGNGGWYIGGRFTAVDGEPRDSLAHINAAGQLTDWNPGVGGGYVLSRGVFTLAMDNGVIYAGGRFTTAGGQSRSNLAAFNTDGTLLDWNPGSSGVFYHSVSTLAIDNGVIYAGGRFTTAGGQPRSNLAAFDADGALLDWNPGAGDTVSTLAIDNGVIYAGGGFGTAGGESRDHLAAFDTGGELLDWKPGADDSVSTLAIENGVIYAGGRFTAAGGESRSNLAAFDTDGALLDWNPGAGDTVSTLAIDNGVIYAGGWFTEAGGQSRDRLAAFNTNGALLDWNPGVDRSVSTLSVDNGVIYAGGSFGTVGGQSRDHLAAFDSNGALLDWNPGTDGPVITLAIENEVIYAGGNFDTVGGQSRSGLAAFDTDGTVLDWSPGVNRSVSTLAVDNEVIYVGGNFFTAGGQSRDRLAAFDTGGALLDWNPGADGPVFTLAIENGVIYAGGNFGTAGGQSRDHLAALDSNGALLDWNPGANNGVRTFAIDNGVIYAGGSFTEAGGEPRERLAAFDTDGALLDWNPGAGHRVRTLAIGNGVIYAGGWFTEAGGEPRERLAAFDTDGALLDWNPGAGNRVRTLAIDNGAIYAGGRFTRVGGELRGYLVAFDTDGALLDWNPYIP